MNEVDQALADELSDYLGRSRVQPREVGLETELAEFFGVSAGTAPKPFAKWTSEGLVITGKDQPDGPSAQANEAELMAALAAADVKLFGGFVGGYFLPAVAKSAEALGYAGLAHSLTALAKQVGTGVCQVARADGKPWAANASTNPAGKCGQDGRAYGVLQTPVQPTLPVERATARFDEVFELEGEDGRVLRVAAASISQPKTKKETK